MSGFVEVKGTLPMGGEFSIKVPGTITVPDYLYLVRLLRTVPRVQTQVYGVRAIGYPEGGKVKAVKGIRELLGYQLKEAVDVVESMPTLILDGLFSKEEALEAVRVLSDFGVEAEVVETDTALGDF